ncbi:hypothetical protein [Solemya velum gill symbiont]|uniref:Uncharacterized protein n=1 Tax=Solemya velum gill symbiont TaxID=2340 RepID=A0A0B0HB06_SOVGS|nr:hypothetical protein [Solemya velum gill symbiont]KHF25837.1 hypothetical protein JV46_19750 [Solemya velum gill symbiont]OOY34538.1 hypothetical protein BOV88_09545 [Solemya velum gill symbiont]OOY37253.1 hypothetical protein BOV89_08385 [Solemya velum gill symbiont]OOY39753.1 hypothetical protein BOV90_07610 [Solemya velum gill symbiont]OOY42525.1 hypothetical protein BOV91_06710 [Solemya velum gill symbiont]
MSDIQLSPELFQRIQQAIIEQEPEAQQDSGVMMQYLAALMGYILGSQQEMPSQTKEEFMEELSDFARHVMRDADGRVQQQRQTQAANAFGIWTPKAD